jgi:PPM family protein phosphatase
MSEIMRPESFYLEMVSLTDPGRVRALNEDAVAVDRQLGFAVVADGMGGHRAGDVASHLALEWVVDRLRTQTRAQSTAEFAERIIAEANSAIHARATQQSECRGMGTTLAMAIFDKRRVALAHVGDSRIYRLRKSRLELLTRDDSMLTDQVELGLITLDDAGGSHNRHLVTQALGIGPQVTAHLQEQELRSGDVYLLCTDGLNDLVDEKDMELIIDKLKTNLPLVASHLVQLANDNGGSDNIAVALVRVLDEAPVVIKRKGWTDRLLGWLKS